VYFSGARRYDLSRNITLLADTQPEFFIWFEAGEGLTMTYIIYVSFENSVMKSCYVFLLLGLCILIVRLP
jgi:hypothetical protein